MKSNRTSRQSKTGRSPSARKKVAPKAKKAPARKVGANNHSPSQTTAPKRSSAASRPRAQSKKRVASPASRASRGTSKPKAPGKCKAASGVSAAQGHPPKATLPGTLLQRGRRWWWNVALPGEDKPMARPLKPEGAKAATEDRATAEKVAFEMWERVITEAAERRARAQTDQTIARLKAQFLQKVRDFSQVLETAKAKAEAEAQARAQAEAKLRGASNRPAPVLAEQSCPAETVACECCGVTGIPISDVHRIDSGQLLCPDCLTALRAEVRRIHSEIPADCYA